MIFRLRLFINKKMKFKKYYIGYLLSILFLAAIWIGPTLIVPEEKTTEEFVLKRTEGTIFEQIIPESEMKSVLPEEPKEEEKEPDKRNHFWLVLSNLDTILSVIVGGVNVYLISSHYKAKKKGDEPKEDPKRIKKIFNPEPFD